MGGRQARWTKPIKFSILSSHRMTRQRNLCGPSQGPHRLHNPPLFCACPRCGDRRAAMNHQLQSLSARATRIEIRSEPNTLKSFDGMKISIFQPDLQADSLSQSSPMSSISWNFRGRQSLHSLDTDPPEDGVAKRTAFQLLKTLVHAYWVFSNPKMPFTNRKGCSPWPVLWPADNLLAPNSLWFHS
jgi:hypothetical protein